MIEQQGIMECIGENSERLELLEKTLVLEQRQKKRMQDLSKQKQKELAEAHTLALYEGTLNSTTSVLEQEDAVRKDLVDAMVKNSTPSNGPVVKVLTNVQGILKYYLLTKI